MIGSLGGALPPRPGAEVEICASPVLSGIKAISVHNQADIAPQAPRFASYDA